MNEEKEKKNYELALLVKTEEDVPRAIELLRQHNGEVLAEPRPKKLALAYKIKGETEGVFAAVSFRAAGEDAKNLEHDLVTRPEVLRSMVVIAPKEIDRPTSAMPFVPGKRPGRYTAPSPAVPHEAKPAAPRPLSNEALEKKIEEILG